MESPLTENEVRLIAVEEGLRSACVLDNLRLQMLHEAVDWLMDLTDLPKTEIRRQLAVNKGKAVAKSIGTIKVARHLIEQQTSS